MKTYLIYLAGPITGLTYEGCTGWRDFIIKSLPPNIVGVSPMRMKENLVNEIDIADNYKDHVLSNERAISCRDHYDVRRCDVILANFLGATKVSIGTVLEIGHARAYDKPIIVAMKDDNIHQHAMIRGYAGFLVSSLEDAILAIRGLCSP